MIEEVFAQAPSGTDILVIDDNSPDGTGGIADAMVAKDPRVFVMHRPGKLGLGSAYVQGFGWALARPYEAVIHMDCDFSHDPKDLPRLIEALSDCDLALGSRYVQGGAIQNWPWHRRLISRCGNLYARSVLQIGIKDLTGGFKAYKRKVLESLDLSQIASNGYAFLSEMKFKVVRKGFRVREIPIIFKDRTQGKSKMSKKIFLEAAIMVWRLRLSPEGGNLLPSLALAFAVLAMLHYYCNFMTNHHLPDFLPGLSQKISGLFK
ncbi:MAG: hypothetical protein A2901_08105 [Elusimicrobia bacterium RIFCSPLOWO2_01_FULL_54_10]|nr:MAG: hypothetical protein A2901_08105 [Elusimicrobia bacterium RIFCSPLOWO2_01_FULL_54_10]